MPLPKPTVGIRTFRAAVDLSWRRITLDLTKLTEQNLSAPDLSNFPHLRDVVVTCNLRMQPCYWTSARLPHTFH